MKKKKPTSTHTITGILMADQWDEDGNITELSIYTDNEEVYHLAHDKPTRKLFSYLQKKVVIEGAIRVNTDGNRVIEVKTVKKAEEPTGIGNGSGSVRRPGSITI